MQHPAIAYATPGWQAEVTSLAPILWHKQESQRTWCTDSFRDVDSF